jgi:hypothetical protein
MVESVIQTEAVGEDALMKAIAAFRQGTAIMRFAVADAVI